MNLFVAKLNSSTSTRDLQNLFSHYGLVTTVKVIFDRGTGRSKCYGFVEMPNNHEAHEALKELDNTTFQENVIAVKESQPADDRIPSSGTRNSIAQSHGGVDNQERKIRPAMIIKTQRDDYSRRNLGYRGSDYRNFI